MNWPRRRCPTTWPTIAVALNHVAGHDVDREDLLVALAAARSTALRRARDADGRDAARPRAGQRSATLGATRPGRARRRATSTGGAVDITADGHLVVDDATTARATRHRRRRRRPPAPAPDSARPDARSTATSRSVQGRGRGRAARRRRRAAAVVAGPGTRAAPRRRSARSAARRGSLDVRNASSAVGAARRSAASSSIDVDRARAPARG